MTESGAVQLTSATQVGGTGIPFIRLERICKTFPAHDGAPTKAVDNVDLHIGASEFVSLLGPSGCGKSTLLSLVAGLTAPTSGVISIGGAAVNHPYTNIGIVFQSDLLLDWRTVLGNVLMQFEMRGQDPRLHEMRARAILASVGLQDFTSKYPWELSGGMRQRVSICRALIHDPSLLLMDEPFGALDALTREQLQVDLQRLWQTSGKTVVFVTHSISEAVFLSDRVVVMTPRPGRIHQVLRIDLPRPRELDVRDTDVFTINVRYINHHLPRHGSGPLNERLKNLAWSGSSVILVFAGWDIAVRVFHIPAYLLPSPFAAFASIAENWRVLAVQALWTTIAIGAGFIAAALVAIPLAMLIVLSHTLGRLLYPPIVAIQAIPKIALAPLFVVWFGFGSMPKVAVAFLIAFFPIMIDTIVGLRSIDPGMLQLARSMGAPQHRIFLRLRLPNALPMIFSGLKVASTLAVVGALTGEFVGSDRGLGYVLLQASGNLNTALLFAALIILSVLALAFFHLVELCERILIPWHVSQRTH